MDKKNKSCFQSFLLFFCFFQMTSSVVAKAMIEVKHIEKLPVIKLLRSNQCLSFACVGGGNTTRIADVDVIKWMCLGEAAQGVLL